MCCSFLLASSDAQTIAQNPLPSLIPDGKFLDNVSRVLNSDIKFWQALWNSVLVAVITSISVVLFATLAGFSFAKLQFRGRRALLVFVIATMAVPTQLGVVPLFILMSELGWTGKLVAVIVPGMVTAFGVFWMTQYFEETLPFELIEAVHLGAQAGTMVAELSYGQQRQLEIALALAGAPRFVLFDEPAAGLSPTERRELVEILQALPDHIGFVIIEHDMDVALRVVESVTMLHNGRIFKEGTPAEIESDPEVQQLYLGQGNSHG